MSKIDDARDILEQLGLPQAQRNDISCLTLLALTGLSEDDAWSQASRPSRSIHQILGFMRDVYEREYAENTRETVRRQVIHQFEQARIVDRNPDVDDQDLYTIVITTYIPPRQVGDGPWTPWYADYYHPEV